MMLVVNVFENHKYIHGIPHSHVMLISSLLHQEVEWTEVATKRPNTVQDTPVDIFENTLGYFHLLLMLQRLDFVQTKTKGQGAFVLNLSRT